MPNIVHTHVKPIAENESVAYLEYFFNMENHKYFQYFMLMFREEMLLTADDRSIRFLKFLNMLNGRIHKHSKAYMEYLQEQEEKDDESNND